MLRRGVIRGSERSRAGRGGGSRGRAGAGGAAALGGAAKARSPWAAAVRPRSLPGPVKPTSAASASNFPVWLPKSSRNYLGQGGNVRIRAGERDLKAKKSPKILGKLASGFGRSSGFSGGYVGVRSRQVFRFSRGRRFPGRQTRRGQASGGRKSCRGRGSGAAVPLSPGGPERRLGMDGRRDEQGQRANEICFSPLSSGKNRDSAICIA